MGVRRFGRFAACCGTFVLALGLTLGPVTAQTSTDERVKALEEQLNLMMQQLQAVQRELAQTRADVERARGAAQEAREQAGAVAQAQDTATQERETTQPGVTSGQPKVKLAISGQVNRAVNVVNDGNETDAFFVDNDVSNSRIRFVGTGDLGEGTTLGTRIEIAVSPNNSFDVSQDDEDSGDFFDQRKVEIFARNDDYGQFSLGKGNTASEDTAEYDLSLVAGPIMYSGVSDIVGGLQFTDGDSLTGITLGDAFFNFDGNGRRNRVLYDSPVFGPGVQFSASAASDDRLDLAATWGGDYGDWTGVEIGDFLTLGAVAISDPDIDDVDYRINGSASVLHMPSGLSITFSGGMDEAEEDNPYNLYAKLGWDTEFFGFGPTGFGVDFTHSENVCAECDEGRSAGIAAVQVVEDWGLELYSQLRWFSLDTEAGAPDTDDVFAFTLGSRAKF
ncbi:hypothetical protein [Pelagibius sp.]|uniref:hypothetical protein n=1 Tax=Pelagibius sp. TaxID=1931238 RepID=UPI003B502255